MSNFTPAWFKKGFFNESLFCDDFLSTHQLLYSNGAFFTPDGRMVDPMPLRCEIFEMMREYVGTVQPSLFLPKFPLLFLAPCRKSAYSQNFLLTRLDFCGNLSQQLNITYFYIFVQTLRG